MNEEIFVDIKDYKGLYKISKLGNVKSLPKSDGNGNRERLLKQETVQSSVTKYKRVTFSVHGKTKRFTVHRLVAQAFIPNPENKQHVNHIDNNGENNKVGNLEWCTHSENMLHAQKQGRLHAAQSKGGKTLGSKVEARVALRQQEILSKTWGNWRPICFIKRLENKGKYYLWAECLLCNKEYKVSSSNMTTAKTTNCRNCGLKLGWVKRKKK